MQRIHWPNTSEGLTIMAKTLEDVGVSSVLLPYGPEGQDFLLHMPDVFRSTNKIRMMLAVGAYAVTPEYLAKSFHSAQQYGKNRLDLNLVAGRYSEEFQQMAMEYYPRDPSEIDSHEKRVKMTRGWMEKFYFIMNKRKGSVDAFNTRLAVVGSSDLTINIANIYTDYIIITDWIFRDKITTSTPILVIDPLILNPGQDPSEIKYHNYQFKKDPHHPISGTFEEVIRQIKDISTQYNINEFMIHTDQENIDNLLKLVKYMTENNNILD
jgi:hypothetical protein